MNNLVLFFVAVISVVGFICYFRYAMKKAKQISRDTNAKSNVIEEKASSNEDVVNDVDDISDKVEIAHQLLSEAVAFGLNKEYTEKYLSIIEIASEEHSIRMLAQTCKSMQTDLNVLKDAKITALSEEITAKKELFVPDNVITKSNEKNARILDHAFGCLTKASSMEDIENVVFLLSMLPKKPSSRSKVKASSAPKTQTA